MRLAIDELKARDERQKDIEKETQRRILELQKRMAEQKLDYAKRVEYLKK
jgi:hypothetical protein